MKLSIAFLATLLIHTQAGLVVLTFTGDCTYDALQDAANVAEVSTADLISLLSITGDADDAAVQAEILCQDARDANSDPHPNRGGAYAFGDITGEGWQYDNNYFDGGTDLNEEYEPKVVNITAFEDIYDGLYKDTLITFPEDTVEKNFGNCEAQTVMCCWVQDRFDDGNNDGNCEEDDCKDADPADNTDICYVDLEKSRGSNHVEGGYAVYSGSEDEGDSHCHGFAWSNDETSTDYRYRGNALFFVSMYDHLALRGYVREVPGAPMCSCLEKMPVVSRSDCTELTVTETYEFTFRNNGRNSAVVSAVNVEQNGCTDNNLATRFAELTDAEEVDDSAKTAFDKQIVGDCTDAILNTFLETKGYKYTSPE